LALGFFLIYFLHQLFIMLACTIVEDIAYAITKTNCSENQVPVNTRE